MKELGGTGGRGFFQSKDVRKKLSEDENKQGKREEEVRLLNLPLYEKYGLIMRLQRAWQTPNQSI